MKIDEIDKEVRRLKQVDGLVKHWRELRRLKFHLAQTTHDPAMGTLVLMQISINSLSMSADCSVGVDNTLKDLAIAVVDRRILEITQELTDNGIELDEEPVAA